MSSQAPPPPTDPLQFDTAHFAQAPTGMACQACTAPLLDRYWQAGGNTLCDRCKEGVERSIAEAGTRGAFLRAALRAGAVAFACGVVYAAIVGATDATFGLLTIGIGYLVGRSVQAVTRGFGTRRYQVLAVVLTYMAASMGNAVPVVRAVTQPPAATATATSPTPTAASAGAPQTPSAAPSATPPAAPATPPDKAPSAGSLVLGLLGLVALCLVSPFLMLSAGASGFMSLLIVGFGLLEAWRRAAGVALSLSGPHTVAAPSPTPHDAG